MALTMKSPGSGHFAAVRDWSCPVHDNDVNYSEDCDAWEHEGEICLDCATGRWVDRRDADGNVVTYEVGAWEWMLLEQARSFFDRPSALLASMVTEDGCKITWLEDTTIPRSDAV